MYYIMACHIKSCLLHHITLHHLTSHLQACPFLLFCCCWGVFFFIIIIFIPFSFEFLWSFRSHGKLQLFNIIGHAKLCYFMSNTCKPCFSYRSCCILSHHLTRFIFYLSLLNSCGLSASPVAIAQYSNCNSSILTVICWEAISVYSVIISMDVNALDSAPFRAARRNSLSAMCLWCRSTNSWPVVDAPEFMIWKIKCEDSYLVITITESPLILQENNLYVLQQTRAKEICI